MYGSVIKMELKKKKLSIITAKEPDFVNNIEEERRDIK